MRIILGSDGQTVENNVFARTMGTLNDGAAVYTNCNASIIRGNIILDTIGDLEYSHPWWPMGHGIWPEFLSNFHDTVITDNTLYGNNGHGIFLPNNFDCTISGNVIVDSRRAALGLYVDSNPDQGHVITGNTLVTTLPTRRIDHPETSRTGGCHPTPNRSQLRYEYESTADYGTMSHTTFVAPASLAGVIRKEPPVPCLHPRRVDRRCAFGLRHRQSRQPQQCGSRLRTTPKNRQPSRHPRNLDPARRLGRRRLPSRCNPWRSAVLVTTGGVGSTPPSRGIGTDWRAETPVTSYLGDDSSIFADDFESGDLLASGRPIQ